jgi:dienelactone hydrolase
MHLPRHVDGPLPLVRCYHGGYLLTVVVRFAQASLASSVDRLVATFALHRAMRSRADADTEALPHAERMEALAALHERHRDPRFSAAPEVFFGRAGEAGPWVRSPIRSIPGGQIVDVRWRSGYAVLAPEPEVRERYLRRHENHQAHARLYLHHDRPRPTALLIHGYLGGTYAVEERAWPVRWMFEKLGLDVAIPVLPFHGPRGTPRRLPLFPSSDPRINVEAFRQAIWDLVSLRRALMERGCPAVGVMGMSLGGYTSALATTADPELAFAVPIIPLASVADAARDGGRLVGTPEEQREQHAALERAHRPVSPLARPGRLGAERLRVVAGEADRITPLPHAERLAAHLGAPLHVFRGGHLVQLGRDEGFREAARMLRDLGLLARRRGR